MVAARPRHRHAQCAIRKQSSRRAAGGAYEHAYERADVESGPVATAGGFLLNLRAHVMRGADGLLHQNPAMDVEDVLAVKARAKQAKLAARGVGVRR